jgi:hypothetical protein
LKLIGGSSSPNGPLAIGFPIGFALWPVLFTSLGSAFPLARFFQMLFSFGLLSKDLVTFNLRASIPPLPFFPRCVAMNSFVTLLFVTLVGGYG